MQKLSHTHANKKVVTKFLTVIILIALGIIILALGRNVWINMNLQHDNAKNQIAALEKKIDTMQQDVQVAVANQPVDMQAFNIAQIRNAYLLVRTASNSLQYDHNISIAKQLLQLATENLANIHTPKVEQAKVLLAADQAKLNAVEMPEMHALQEKLDILDKLINVLPAYGTMGSIQVATKPPLAQTRITTKPTWLQRLSNMFGDLKNIITIRKKDDKEFHITDIELARAQVKLLIEQLRWAAFYNNVDVYQRCIKMAQTLLPEAFDINSESVQKFAATLQELEKIQLRPTVPNLQNSVNALQALLVG